MTNSEFLRDLANRLMHVPAIYGTDQGDVDRLNAIAKIFEDRSPSFQRRQAAKKKG